jgi:Fic family protein
VAFRKAASGDSPFLLEALMAGDLASLAKDGNYLHWDELRHRKPPLDISHEEWWVALKLARHRRAVRVDAMTRAYRALGPHAHRFEITNLVEIQERLHALDRFDVAGILVTTRRDGDVRTEYRVRQLIEEAISSSEIEGARPTTREIARQLVRENRPPSSRDEAMILNNFRAMERILELHQEGRAITTDDLLELHHILGESALEVEGAAGKFRGPEHRVTVEDAQGETWYTPPPAEGLEDRVAALLRFAAREEEESEFIHPIVRAIVCHFWLAYEHPFRDGNGRMARALFYWCMLRYGYEIAEFLSISGPIDRSPKRYYLAFAHTETDGGDLTYFVLHQLDVIEHALTELEDHLEQRAAAMTRLAQIISGFEDLNHRQRALLQHAIRNPSGTYTIEGHARSHRVHYVTAQKDLADLVKRRFLAARQDGQGKRFHPARSLSLAARGG